MASQTMIVTGAASGIGRDLVGKLVSAGHRVFAVDIDEAGLKRAWSAGDWSGVELRKLDVRDWQAWDKLVAEVVDKWGRLDVLLSVAGVLKPGYVYNFEAKDVDFHIDINVKGVMYGARSAARQMVKQRSGHIVNVASLAGIAPSPGLCLYSASKFAVRGFSLSIATELKPHGVAVTSVCPDAVQTPMLDLQVHHKEAAMTFGGPRALTVAEVNDVILDVLKKKPVEVRIDPPGSGRAFGSFLSGTMPNLVQRFLPAVAEQGMKMQEKIKKDGVPAAEPPVAGKHA